LAPTMASMLGYTLIAGTDCHSDIDTALETDSALILVANHGICFSST